MTGLVAFTGESGSFVLTRTNSGVAGGKVNGAFLPDDATAGSVAGTTIFQNGSPLLQILEGNSPAGTTEERVNGTVEATGTTVVRSTFPASNSGAVSLGGSGTGTSLTAILLAERVAIRGLLTTTEKQKLEGYFAYRYGLQSLLSGAHPYKVSPP